MSMKSLGTGLWNSMDKNTGAYGIGAAAIGGGLGAMAGVSGQDGSAGRGVAGGIAGALGGYGAAVGLFKGLGKYTQAGAKAGEYIPKGEVGMANATPGSMGAGLGIGAGKHQLSMPSSPSLSGSSSTSLGAQDYMRSTTPLNAVGTNPGNLRKARNIGKESSPAVV